MVNTIKTYSNQSLFVDFGNPALVQIANSNTRKFFNRKNNRPKINYFKEGWRCPWSEIDMKNRYYFNYHITVNPDPKCDWMTNCQDRKLHNDKLREFVLKIKSKGLFKYILVIYEYGNKGKSCGKLHYHILFKTHASAAIAKEANQIFGTTNKRCEFTTIVKKIKIDNKLSKDATPTEKIQNYNEQIDYLIDKYFRKETQNKVKCLFTNIQQKKNKLMMI